jgi:NAD-dependent deacetylase
LDPIDQLAIYLKNSTFSVVLTGAGISTPSGLPDYRGPNGLWTNADRHNLDHLDPKRYRLTNLADETLIKPNTIHYTITKLVEAGLVKKVISQNIDNLHRRSGLNEDNLIELHGNFTIMKCINCDSRFTRKEVGWDYTRFGRGYLKEKPHDDQPTCRNCDNRIISTVVNFGDPMPRNETKLAHKYAKLADCYIVIGSSLGVAPASIYPKIAKKHNSTLIIINLQTTPLDDIADLVINQPAETVFQKLLPLL